MAKDDYFVIVAKILAFLYQRLKGKEDREVLDYIQADSKEFPISEEYLDYVVMHMYKDQLIERVFCRVDSDGDPFEVSLMDETRITPEGITYLYENSMILKAIKHIPSIASALGGFL